MIILKVLSSNSNMRNLLLFAAIFFCFQYCDKPKKTDTLALKKEQFLSDGPLYTFPMCILYISSNDKSEADCTKEKIVCCIKDLYGYMNIRIFGEDDVRNRIFKLYSQNSPVVVSTELYNMLSIYKVNIDKELSEVYTQQGIEGILRILSSKDLRRWELEDYDKFKYIISLCWEHDIFFAEHIGDEFPSISWSISGNRNLIDKYYMPTSESYLSKR